MFEDYYGTQEGQDLEDIELIKKLYKSYPVEMRILSEEFITTEDLCYMVREASHIGRLLERLPRCIHNVTPATLTMWTKSLCTHSDEVFEHPDYFTYLWRSHEPQTLLRYRGMGVSTEILQKYASYSSFATYLTECEARGINPEGEYYHLYKEKIADRHADSTIVKMVMDAGYLPSKSSDLEKIYSRYITDKYGCNLIGSIEFLLVVEAMHYRGLAVIYDVADRLSKSSNIKPIVQALLNMDNVDTYLKLSGNSVVEIMESLGEGDIPEDYIGRHILEGDRV